MTMMPHTIGILAVQGAFEAHARAVRNVGHQPMLIRSVNDLFSGLGRGRLAGFIFPGGESTVQLDLIERLELEQPLRNVIASGIPILATCAGLILLAQEVTHPNQRSFGVIDVAVARNGWGRQVDSFEAVSDDPDHTRELIFIRAPRITRVGPSVEVIDRLDGEPVLVRSKNITCATFHPELGQDRELHHQIFARPTPILPAPIERLSSYANSAAANRRLGVSASGPTLMSSHAQHLNDRIDDVANNVRHRRVRPRRTPSL